jgi:hypothetical protein
MRSVGGPETCSNSWERQERVGTVGIEVKGMTPWRSVPSSVMFAAT